MPKLSIIIPTFNSATTIQRCLRSIQVQTFKNYEIVVQDGGSTDRTVELIQEFGRDNPALKLELESVQDKGVYDAMNKAMCRASGRWLYILGSDDELYDQNVLRKAMRSFAVAYSNFLYGNVQMIGNVNVIPDGTVYDGLFNRRKLLNRNICHQAIFYRAALAAKVGTYNLDYSTLADWDFNMRCWAIARPKYIDLIVAKFYSGGITSRNGGRDPRFEADLASNKKRYFGENAEKDTWAERLTPRRIFWALVRRFGIT